MTTAAEIPFTLAFVGHADAAMSAQAAAYEDEVLPLLEEHGARLLYRGRRAEGQDPSLPFEVHLIWFPNRHALASYMADGRRAELQRRYGEVFRRAQAVEVEAIAGSLPGGVA